MTFIEKNNMIYHGIGTIRNRDFLTIEFVIAERLARIIFEKLAVDILLLMNRMIISVMISHT